MIITEALRVPGIPLTCREAESRVFRDRGQATEVTKDTEGSGTVFVCDFSVVSVVKLFKLTGD